MTLKFPASIYNLYSSYYNRSVLKNFLQSTDLNKSNAFCKFMKIDLTKDVVEVPCIFKAVVHDSLRLNLNQEADPFRKYKHKLYIPMMHRAEDSLEAKSSNVLIKKFFQNTSFPSCLSKMTGSGVSYLGGPGIILYEDFTPLIMFTLTIKKTVTETGKLKYTPVDQILRINPIIYNKSDLLAKYLRGKFLSSLLDKSLFYMGNVLNLETRPISIYKHWNSYNVLCSKTIISDTFKIIVEDFSKFFVTPKEPDVTFDSTEVNRLLVENIDDILNF